METKEVLADALLLETLNVTAVESVEQTVLVREGLEEHELAPCVALKRHVVFAVDRLHLTIGLIFAEERRDEELRESVESAFEGLVGNLELVVGVGKTRVSIAVAAIVLDEFGVFIFAGVLFRAHEQHVLQEMGRAVERLRVQRAADVHIERGGRFVSLVV